MKNTTMLKGLILVIGISGIAGCSPHETQSPDVTSAIRRDLDQARLNDVTVNQDRDKGVVTLGGHVNTEADKSQAESIAKSDAAGQVVALEVAVLPPNDDNAKTVNSDLDKGIDKNLDAALVQAKLDHGVKYDIKNGVVTLKGEVNSQGKRSRIEKLATGVPNVKQVVNELQVKDQKATESK